MSQVASLRRARERREAETSEQTEARRARARDNYWKNKAKGKHQTTIPYKALGGWTSYTSEEVN